MSKHTLMAVPRCTALTWLALLAALPLAAAEQHGVVKFGGLPVPGVTITATKGDQKLVAVTNSQGTYSFRDLPDGVWTFQVEMQCFAPIHSEVAIAPGAPSPEWDLKLLPLDAMKAVVAAPEPKAAAPGTAAEARPKTASKGFQRADLKAAGEASSAPADTTPVTGDASDAFSVNGSMNNGAASPFAQAAAFGNNRKSGSGMYTGAISATLGNSALDARSFSLTGQDTPKAAYNHLQGNVSFGGPLVIPHWMPLTRTSPNFFLGYQWTRNRNASIQSALMPTAAQRAGDFPGGAIPASLLSPQALALLKYYPLPNFTSDSYNYQIPIVGTSNTDGVQSRLNKTINGSNQVFGSFAWQRSDSETPNLFGFTDSTHSSGLDSTVNWVHRFGPRRFMHLRYEYSRSSTRVTPYFANRENVSGDAGITGNDQEPINWGPPSLTFASGIAGLYDAQPVYNRNQTSALSGDSFWNHRSHNVTYGADFRRQQFNYLSQQNPRGAFTFTDAGTGSDFADFLLGVPATSSIAFGNADKYFRQSVYDAYATDDWRVRPGLTLNAGARWEYSAPITEIYGRLVNLDIAPGFAAEAPVVASDPLGTVTGQRYPASLVHPDKHGIQPRIGVAWRPISGSSMVVRAGYGVTYNTSVYQAIANQMAQQSPLSKSLSVANSLAYPFTMANAFNGSPAITPNTFAIDPNFRIGYSQSWQVSVQRDLPAALVLTATYLGIKGTRGAQEFLPNTYPTGATNPCPSCPSGYVYLASNGNSTRESGQLQLRRRLHNGFTASLQYTWAKAIDDATLGGRATGTTVIAQNWLDLSAERGLSPFDQRQLLNLQLQYTTGMGVRGGTLLSGWRGLLFKEWTVSSQVTVGTGLPLTPTYLATVSGTGVTGSIRPEYTGAPLYAPPAGLYLNPAAYVPPLAGQWGNAGRDSITGPAQFSLNGSLARTFRLNDRFNADVRLDTTNALNHVTYASWVTNITSAQFGLPTSANAMRSAQATLRIRF